MVLMQLVVAQVAVGIATLIHAVPLGLAIVHQALALILLLALVWNASVFRRGLSMRKPLLAGGV
ncbi:MAG: hypothetical protein ACRED5_10785 [Propylenella sp.]